jgi:uncharacterized Zn-binding protein involved in type VI secretion
MPNEKPAAKEKDLIVAVDTHLCNGTPTPLPFNGVLDGNLSPNVLIEHRRAAMVGSTATNTPKHVAPPGKAFDKPPSNRGVVITGAPRVFINHRKAARNEETAETCNDPKDLPVGKVAAGGTVLVGD